MLSFLGTVFVEQKKGVRLAAYSFSIVIFIYQMISLIGSSSVSLKVCKNFAPIAPSTTR